MSEKYKLTETGKDLEMRDILIAVSRRSCTRYLDEYLKFLQTLNKEISWDMPPSAPIADIWESVIFKNEKWVNFAIEEGWVEKKEEGPLMLQVRQVKGPDRELYQLQHGRIRLIFSGYGTSQAIFMPNHTLAQLAEEQFSGQYKEEWSELIRKGCYKLERSEVVLQP